LNKQKCLDFAAYAVGSAAERWWSVHAMPVAKAIMHMSQFLVLEELVLETVNLFKSRLDKFWINQEVKCDHTTELTGTGDRSEYLDESDRFISSIH